MTLYVKLILQYDSILFKKWYMLLLSPTPLTLICGGGGPIIPLLVHQPAYPIIVHVEIDDFSIYSSVYLHKNVQ